MMTAPFGPALEAALRETRQGGKLYCCKGAVVNPRFFCCLSGTNVGVAKDPVAVLAVSPLRGCFDPGGGTGDDFTADVSHSWSPSSTINAWSVAWGDGTVDAVVPPAVGTHQYTLPGTYTITLTATDLLGAIGVDTVQVEVLDCVDIPDIEAFCGCGLSGVWYTNNGGRLWEQAGLAGVEVYDLDVSPLTFGMENMQVWAATAGGLYKSIDSGTTWEEIGIPLAAGASVAAVLCSNFDENEAYALSHNAGTQRVWLHRTADGGATWQAALEMYSAPADALELNCGPGLGPAPGKLAWQGGRLYAAVGNTLYWRDHTVPAWNGIAGPPGMTISAIVSGDDCLWAACSNAPRIYRYDGAWTWAGTGGLAGYNMLARMEDGTMFASNVAASQIDVFDANGAFDVALNDPVPTVGSYPGTDADILLAWTGGVARLYEYGGAWATGDFAEVYTTASAADPTFGRFQEWHGAAWIADNSGHVYKRIGGAWVQDVLPAAVVDSLSVCRSDDPDTGERLFAVLNDGFWRVYEKVGGAWLRRCNLSIPALGCVYMDHSDLLYSTTAQIRRLGQTLTATLPAVGRHHLLSMSADGEFVYVAILDGAGRPVFLRANYDLSFASVVYIPNAGTWGGVKADYYNVERVWIFGNMGAAVKVRRSEDYGDTWTTVGDAGWVAGEVVRPVLPDCYDPDDVVAILNTALQTWRTREGAAAVPTWANLGAIAFAAHTGERDWVEPQSVFIGRAAAGAAHLRYSYNLGANWLERSAGLTANAPVVAMVIVG